MSSGLVQLVDYMKKLDNLKVIHRGRVVFNNDPDKLGRIKVQIKSIYEESSTDLLPWCYPLGSFNLPDQGSFEVPEIDSEVVVFFPFGDIYSPFYFYGGGTTNDLTKTPAIFDTNYPETIGRIFREGFWRVNKSKPNLEFLENSTEPSAVWWDEEGNLYINAKNIIIDASQSVYINIGINRVVNVGNMSSENVGVAKETVAGSAIGRVAGSEITDEAGRIDHNSGIIVGITGGLVAVLQSKVAILEEKVAELQSLLQQANEKSEQNKGTIASVD